MCCRGISAAGLGIGSDSVARWALYATLWATLGIGRRGAGSEGTFTTLKWRARPILVTSGSWHALCRKNGADQTRPGSAEPNQPAYFGRGFIANVINPKVAVLHALAAIVDQSVARVAQMCAGGRCLRHRRWLSSAAIGWFSGNIVTACTAAKARGLLDRGAAVSFFGCAAYWRAPVDSFPRIARCWRKLAGIRKRICAGRPWIGVSVRSKIPYAWSQRAEPRRRTSARQIKVIADAGAQ